MADKRKLLLEVDVDVDSKPLKKLGDDAQHAEDGFGELNQGLKKLDAAFDETKQRAADLRTEISKSGDVGLVKDLQKAERELKRIERDRKTVRGDDNGLPDLIPKVDLKKASKAGTDTGVAFADALFAQVSAVAKSPAGIGALIGIGASLAPSIGAAISAGIVGGIGVGGVLGGVALATRDPAVKRELSELGTIASSELRLASAPFVDETLDGIKSIRHAIADSDDDFRRLFASTARNVRPLTEGLAQGAKSLLSGVADVAGVSGPAVKELSAGFAELGDTIGDGLKQLSDNGPEAASAMRNLFAALNLGVGAALGTVNALTEVYGVLDQTRALLTGDLDTFVRYDRAQREIAASAGEAGAGSISLAAGLRESGSAANFAAAGARALKTSLDELLNNQLSMDKANLAVKQGFANLNAELKNGKHTLDDNTQAGRDNRAEILNQIGALDSARKAQIDNGVTVSEANKRFRDGIAAIEANAAKLGYNKDKVNDLTGAYKELPKKAGTTVEATNAPAETKKVNNFNFAIKALPPSKPVRINAITDEANNDIRATQRALAALHDKTVHVRVITSGTGAEAAHGFREQRAGGGPVSAGKTYLVGEKGPELVTPTANGYVHDAKATMTMAKSVGSGPAGWGASSHLTINVPVSAGYIASPLQVQQQILRTLEDLKRKGYF